MSVDHIFGQARPILKLLGAALIVVAALQLFGVHVGFGGGVEANALVGLGLLHI
jgi:hypothetical protein